MSEEYNFLKICRVCCIEGSLMSLFKVHLSKKLMACASIQVWQNDGLPAQICTKCIAKLQIAYQFKKLCEKSDTKLRQYINNEENTENQSRIQKITKTVDTIPVGLEQQPQNEYIYVNCTPVVNNNLATNLNSHNPLHINYNYPHINAYSLQNISIPHSVPLQCSGNGSEQVQTPNNHIFTAGQMSFNSSQMQNILTNKPNISPSIDTKLIKKDVSSSISPEKQNTDKINFREKSLINDTKSCLICGKNFPTNSTLSRHMKIHSSKMQFRCDICHKGFSHSGNCKVHMRMHTNERPYQCEICDKGCRQQQDLVKHMRTHTGERPHICKICNKRFSNSSNLVAHERIHSGEKPYVCSICSKGFCQSNELTKHLRMHSGEKSHICKVCFKGFNGSSTLVVHMRSHTGERPYSCNICKKAFTQSSCLQVHLKRHSGEKNFHCHICKRSFITNANLRGHILTHKTGEESNSDEYLCDKTETMKDINSNSL